MTYYLKSKHSFNFFIICACCLFIACSKSKSVAPLSITSVDVNKGIYNSTVNITGTGFSTNRTADNVRFNGKPAVITAASSTSLTVKVPLKAGTGNITVDVNGTSVSGPIFTYIPSAQVSNYAGTGTKGALNGPGSTASFNGPNALAIDASGNLYVSDPGNWLVRKISIDSVVSTLAGGGNPNQDTDGIGTQASFPNATTAIALDGAGNVYVTQFEGVIRKITPTGVVTTFLDGRFVPGYSFDYPSGLAIDASGNLYVSVFFHNQVQKITSGGVVTNFAGTGNSGSDDNFPGSFFNPAGLKFDPAGTLYVADYNNSKIRAVDPTRHVTTVVGFTPPNTFNSGSVNGPIATASLRGPSDIAIDLKGNIYIADTGNNMIRMISADRTTVSTLAGTGKNGATNGPGAAASFNLPTGIVVDALGNIFVADSGNNVIRKIVMN
ncbi:MAG TPA: IPT/TIG domain-containing protein [Mucilaginibacter sp.]|jgi:sugar lactone lactonase YvrE